MKNIMKSVELEMNLKKLDEEIKTYINKVDIQLTFIDIKYNDRLRDEPLLKELTITMNNLLTLSNKVKDIELASIKNDDLELYWKCEQRICDVVSTMDYIRVKYML